VQSSAKASGAGSKGHSFRTTQPSPDRPRPRVITPRSTPTSASCLSRFSLLGRTCP
jgi:hypothetical protein